MADLDGFFFASFYQGLIPWAWIEASTKGAVLLFTAAEIETVAVNAGVAPAVAGLLGGMGGGITQAYATMGQCSISFWIVFLSFITLADLWLVFHQDSALA